MKTAEDVTVWFERGVVHIKGEKGSARITLDSRRLLDLYNGHSIKAVLETEMPDPEPEIVVTITKKGEGESNAQN